MPQTFAIIPAAGAGQRFGGAVKKQFLEIQGKSLLERAVGLFKETGIFSQIAVCVPRDEMVAARALVSGDGVMIIEGGASRGESVKKGFEALKADAEDIVLIHDAVRPLVTEALIRRVADETRRRGAVIPVVPVSDTIKRIGENQVQKTIDRANLFAVQTPQGFTVGRLRRAYGQFDINSEFTDEAMLLERLGEPVFTVEGEPNNIKVTTRFDLALAEFFIKSNL